MTRSDVLVPECAGTPPVPLFRQLLVFQGGTLVRPMFATKIMYGLVIRYWYRALFVEHHYHTKLSYR